MIRNEAGTRAAGRSDRTAPRLMLNLPNYATTDPGTWDHLLTRARAAEAAGVDSLWVAEHVVLGEDFTAYSDPAFGGRVGVEFAAGPDGAFLDPLIVLASVSAVTTRIRLMTSVLLAALRRPAVLAKACATLDVLSKGRLDLGVGIGWQRAEYVACGVDFERRGDLLDAVLETCQTLWRNDGAEVTSPALGLAFRGIHSKPWPVQAGGVPVYIAGNVHRRSIQRLLRFGSGWMVWGDSQFDPRPAIAAIHTAWAGAGREPHELKIFGNLHAVLASDGRCDIVKTMATVAPLAEAGITDFRFSLPLPTVEQQAAEVLADVVSGFRSAAG